MGYWWVNQGRTSAEELGHGFLWCSIIDRGGRTPWHWHTITLVREGDLVIHHAHGQVHAASRVSHPATEAPRPVDPPKNVRQQRGWLVQVQLMDLAAPIPLAAIPLSMRAGRAQPMFTQAGKVHQIYLSPIDESWFAQFVQMFADRLPAAVVSELNCR